MSEHNPTLERLRGLLVGKKVTSVRISDERPETYTPGPTGFVTLSDGTELKMWGNEGGCACSAGDYPLTELNECDNVITNVAVEEEPATDSYASPDEGHYRIFVFGENKRITLASFDGTDGNGYYGTGYYIHVLGEES